MGFQANGQIFLSLEGIEGESNFNAFKGSSQLSSFSWGAKNAVSVTTSTGLSTGKTSFEEFTVTKNRGIASSGIQMALYMGKRIPKAEIRYYSGGSTTPSLTIILEDVFISSWKLSGAESDKPTETFSMSASRYKTEEIVKNPDGSTRRVVSGWDVYRNMPIAW
jgi:type VI protein secretion system component Hcp